MYKKVEFIQTKELYLFLFDRKNSYFEIDKNSGVNPINLTKLIVIRVCIYITDKYSFPNS